MTTEEPSRDSLRRAREGSTKAEWAVFLFAVLLAGLLALFVFLAASSLF